MKRDLLIQLEEWQHHPLRKPLIIRGARQVGKSWLVNEFGKQFEAYVTINFESDKDAKQFFEGTIRIPALLEKLSLYSGINIVPGKTLLFLDEIQECENALIALRYFKEVCPELHVVAAGSLLDFTIEKIGVPVGRVQFLYLYPLSFGEFLTVQNRDDLRKFIFKQQNDPVIHRLLMDHLKIYFCIGGMPAVVDAWLQFKNIQICQELQDEIIQAYKQDFPKYSRKQQIENVEKMFEAIPLQMGKKFKFSDVDRDCRAEFLKKALMLLCKAGIAHLAYHSSGQAQPLGATKDLKKFKVFYFDIGLAQRILGLNMQEWIILPLEVKHVGAIAEQFVAQEYIAYSFFKSQSELYYWHREGKQSNAEIDFLFLKNGMVIPVEVKAGSRGGLKSLHIFLETHPQSKMALKISEGLYDDKTMIRNIPLYGIEGWILS